MSLFIPVLEGTTREKRRSIFAAKFITSILEEREEIKTELVDPKDFKFPGDGNDPEAKDPRYTEITKNADAFFVVVPEYNHSFPGSLKRMLDSELENYIHKPVAFAGVSAGIFGGARAIESLVPSVREMGMAACFTDVNFQNSYDLFDVDGEIIDSEREKYTEHVNKALNELVWMAKALKWGRENL